MCVCGCGHGGWKRVEGVSQRATGGAQEAEGSTCQRKEARAWGCLARAGATHHEAELLELLEPREVAHAGEHLRVDDRVRGVAALAHPRVVERLLGG